MRIIEKVRSFVYVSPCSAFPKKDVLHASKRFGKNIRPDSTGKALFERFNKRSSNIINACESLVSNPIDKTGRILDYKNLQNKVENDRKRKLLVGSYTDLQDARDDCLSNDLCLIRSLKIPGQEDCRANHVKSEEFDQKPTDVATPANTEHYNRWITDMKTFDIMSYFKVTE